MSVQARSIEVLPVVSSCRTARPNCATPYGPTMSLTQLIGERFLHLADQADTMYRWSGSDHDFTGSNMWSWSTKSLAYAQ